MDAVVSVPVDHQPLPLQNAAALLTSLSKGTCMTNASRRWQCSVKRLLCHAKTLRLKCEAPTSSKTNFSCLGIVPSDLFRVTGFHVEIDL